MALRRCPSPRPCASIGKLPKRNCAAVEKNKNQGAFARGVSCPSKISHMPACVNRHGQIRRCCGAVFLPLYANFGLLPRAASRLPAVYRRRTGQYLLCRAPHLKFSIWAVAVSPLAKPQSPQDFSPPAAHSNFYARRFAAQEKIARKGFLLRETRFPNAKIAPSAMYTRRFCRFSKPSKSAGFRRLETLKGGLTCRRGR